MLGFFGNQIFIGQNLYVLIKICRYVGVLAPANKRIPNERIPITQFQLRRRRLCARLEFRAHLINHRSRHSSMRK